MAVGRLKVVIPAFFSRQQFFIFVHVLCERQSKKVAALLRKIPFFSGIGLKYKYYARHQSALRTNHTTRTTRVCECMCVCVEGTPFVLELQRPLQPTGKLFVQTGSLHCVPCHRVTVLTCFSAQSILFFSF